MGRLFYAGIVLITLLFLATSCATFSPHFKNLKLKEIKSNRGEAIAAVAPVTDPEIAYLSKSFFDHLDQFMTDYDASIVGLMALFAIWMFVRAYESQKRRRIMNWSRLDIALLRIARKNMELMWERHRPGHNVIDVEEWE